MAVVLFDGVCNLCNGTIRFIIARDPQAYFQFAALSSPAADRLLATAAGVPNPLPDTVVLIDGGRAFTRSDAALRIARHLRFPWPVLYGLVIVPRPVRDAIYDAIARRRYRWFGRREACMVPAPRVRDRFLS
jgi:predicted DCC family thiol-disulfide oxidoreductase YuxK